MAQVVVTLKIMPESPDTDLDKIKQAAEKAIGEFGGSIGKVEKTPVAFGLKSLDFFFIMDEDIGSTEALEEQLKCIAHVNSVDVTDVRRAIE